MRCGRLKNALFVEILVHHGTSCSTLELILAGIRELRALAHLRKDELAYTMAGLEFNGITVGVEQFQGDFALESWVYPSSVLYEQAKPPHGAAALDKRSQIVRKFYILHRCGENELTGKEQITVSNNLFVLYFLVEMNDAFRLVINNAESIAKANINAGGLDLVLLDRLYAKLSGLEHLGNLVIGQNHYL